MKENKEIKKIKKIILPILKDYKITKAGIFGSYARGENKKGSDIDILVETQENMGLLKFIELRRLLQEAIKKKVDLVEYITIREELKKQILNDEISILQ